MTNPDSIFKSRDIILPTTVRLMKAMVFPVDMYVCETARDTDEQNSLLDSVGDGEGGMISENGTETYILSYVKRITSTGLMHGFSSSHVWM